MDNEVLFGNQKINKKVIEANWENLQEGNDCSSTNSHTYMFAYSVFFPTISLSGGSAVISLIATALSVCANASQILK